MMFETTAHQQSQIRFRKPPQNMMILIAVLILHVVMIANVWYLLPVYTAPESPNIRALRVHFVSVPVSDRDVAQIAQKKSTVETGVTPQQASETADNGKKQLSPSVEETIVHTRESHQVLFRGEQKRQEQLVQHTIEQTDEGNVQPHAQSHLSPVKAALDAKSSDVLLDVHIQQPSIVQPKDGLTSTAQQAQHQTQGGMETGQGQQLANPQSIANSSPVKPVSRIDVISFGQLKYFDRELLGQQRLVVLRLQINQRGQPVEVTLQQSSGIASLDQRAIRAAKIAKFEPYRENGRATDVVVDFPIQLRFERPN